VILEQQRCPFCGHAPWLWNPSARFLIVIVIIALFILLLQPLMPRHETPDATSVSDTQ